MSVFARLHPYFTEEPKKAWHIDEVPPYPFSLRDAAPYKANPCSSEGLNIPTRIGIGDHPGWPVFGIGLSGRFLYGVQEFETCVVCLGGQEAWTRKSRALVYGCIKWGHSVGWNADNRRYRYIRWIGDDREIGDENTVADSSNYQGRWRSQVWVDAVASW